MGAAHVSWFSGSQWTRSWSLVPPRVRVPRQGNRTRRQPTHWLLTVDRVDGRWSKRSLRPRTDDATVVMTQAMFTGLKERNVDVILKINWDQRGWRRCLSSAKKHRNIQQSQKGGQTDKKTKIKKGRKERLDGKKERQRTRRSLVSILWQLLLISHYMMP